MERKPIEWRQLCAIVRAEISADPTIDDFEWGERTKLRLVRLGFAYPDPPHRLNEAMRAVERALVKLWGPRPVAQSIQSAPPSPDRPNLPSHGPPWKRISTSNAKWASISELIANLRGGENSAPPSGAPPLEVHGREVSGITEPVALALFWERAEESGTDRLSLLQLFAEIAIVRPVEWDAAALRRQFESFQFGEVDQCFACRSSDRKIVRHHVIQLQHGGSNTPRNFVAICTRCHASIHPWVENASREGWTSVADFAAALRGR